MEHSGWHTPASQHTISCLPAHWSSQGHIFIPLSECHGKLTEGRCRDPKIGCVDFTCLWKANGPVRVTANLFLNALLYSFSRWTHALADPWKEGVCPLNASEILKFLPKVTEQWMLLLLFCLFSISVYQQFSLTCNRVILIPCIMAPAACFL